ncbi:hypothetical protein E4198_13835 [Streptomyces sp. RKND-216]|uniref:hypothetical protein n=1 Tax=Streptomyces sp. RKND-216 TaxID=2562581 RepID=UPI00109DEC40|nr:hypothetical protein [Streptomyces sp. RKND-216]THA25643.1 hypothetical protein E4198_13835 [Streptomyces sp. RKND-216]
MYPPTGRHRLRIAEPRPGGRHARRGVRVGAWQRRIVLLLAVHYGLDLDTRDIHARGVAW